MHIEISAHTYTDADKVHIKSTEESKTIIKTPPCRPGYHLQQSPNLPQFLHFRPDISAILFCTCFFFQVPKWISHNPMLSVSFPSQNALTWTTHNTYSNLSVVILISVSYMLCVLHPGLKVQLRVRGTHCWELTLLLCLYSLRQGLWPSGRMLVCHAGSTGLLS